MKVIKYITTLFDGLYLKGNYYLLRKKFDLIRKTIPSCILMHETNETSLSIFDKNKFLNFYTHYGIGFALTKYGIVSKLKKMGFNELNYMISTIDYTHNLSIFNGTNLLSQLTLSLNKKFNLNNFYFEALTIEWLILQNYTKKFENSKSLPLPGQNYPGLGMAFVSFELIVQIAKRLNINFLANIPDHFHNGVIYSKYFKFKNPVNKGIMFKLLHQFKNFDIATLSWLIENGAIIQNNKNVFEWKTDAMFVSLIKSKVFTDYFNSLDYLKLFYDSYLSNNFIFNYELYLTNKKKYPKSIQQKIDSIFIN